MYSNFYQKRSVNKTRNVNSMTIYVKTIQYGYKFCMYMHYVYNMFMLHINMMPRCTVGNGL